MHKVRLGSTSFSLRIITARLSMIPSSPFGSYPPANLIVTLAAFGIAPIFLLSILAVALVLITRCIDAEEAFSFVDGRLLAPISSMLAIGAALEASGAVAFIVNAIAPALGNTPPFLLCLIHS